jgi:cytochrome c553
MRRVLLATALIASLMNAEEEYVFKAKGEFAKELKQLMEKYAAEGKVEIQEAKETKNGLRDSKTGIIDAFLSNEESLGDIAYGKDIYNKTCFQCHGEKANQSSYASARPLNTLTKQELVEQLENYSRDADYGGNTRMIMHQYANGLLTEEIVSVSAYIYSLNPNSALTPSSGPSGSSDEATTTTTSQGSYLK